MELHQIRYFLAVCDTLNFTRAAMRCHVSQPSLTRAIKLLEDELGGPLFHRERANTHLSALGRSVAPHLREALAQAHEARGRAAAFLALRVARLVVGVATGVAPARIVPALAAFAAAQPEVEIELREEPDAELRAALRRGEIEVAVLTAGPRDIDDLHHQAVGVERLLLLVPGGHRLAGAPSVPIAALEGMPLAVWPDCPGLTVFERHAAEAGIAPGRRLLARTPTMIPALVEAGPALGLREAGFGVPAGLATLTVAGLDPVWPLYAATKRGRPYSPPVRAFVEVLLRRPPSSRRREGA